MNIKDYYKANFKSDSLGDEINPNAGFGDLYKALEDGDSPYYVIGVVDSIIRERLFAELARIKGVDYSVIYNLWLGL